MSSWRNVSNSYEWNINSWRSICIPNFTWNIKKIITYLSLAMSLRAHGPTGVCFKITLCRFVANVTVIVLETWLKYQSLKNSTYFTYNRFKFILKMNFVFVLLPFACPIDNKSALVQVRAWCQAGTVMRLQAPMYDGPGGSFRMKCTWNLICLCSYEFHVYFVWKLPEIHINSIWTSYDLVLHFTIIL